MARHKVVADVGKIAAKFVLGARTGDSRSAVVYSGTCDGKAVQAFKYQPRRPDGADPEDAAGFHQEYLAGVDRFIAVAEKWSAITSDNVARVIVSARVLDDDSAWVVAAADGQPLSERLVDGQPLPPDTVLRLARGLSQGLRDLHAKSVWHLNLSPETILLSPDGATDPATCRLTNLAPDDRPLARIFKAASTLGEPGFSPPELQDASGKLAIGPATDIYGASAVLYRLVTGRTLADWRRKAEYEKALQDLKNRAGGQWPAAFVEAVSKGLAKDYQARADVAADWHGVLESAPPFIPLVDAEMVLPEDLPRQEAVDVAVAAQVLVAGNQPRQPPPKPGAGGTKGGKRPPAGVWIAAAAVVAVLLLAGWWAIASFTARPKDDLVLAGSSSVGEKLAPALVKAWLESKGYGDIRGAEPADKKEVVEKNKDGEDEAHPEYDISATRDGKAYRVHIRAAGTGDGFTRAQKPGAVDIVMASRQIKPEEADGLKGLGDFTRSEHVAAMDGIAVVVARDNPVRQLSVEQVRAVFSGKITDWGDLGGQAGHAIDLYSREKTSGTYDGFKTKIMASETIAKAQVFSAGSELETAVGKDTDGIGFVAMSGVTKNTHVVAVAAVGSNYYVPNSETVRTQVYPLYRRLYFYTSPDTRKPEVDELVRFAESDQGQAVSARVGMVSLSIPPPDLGPKKVEVNTLGDCTLSAFWKDPDALCRIRNNRSPTLVVTFGSNQSDIDSLAKTDIYDRLNDAVTKSATKSIVLVGFTDNVHSASCSGECGMAANRLLSQKRADSVKQMLIQQGWTVQTYGFGEDLPVRPNDTVENKKENRRVEVYIQ